MCAAALVLAATPLGASLPTDVAEPAPAATAVEAVLPHASYRASDSLGHRPDADPDVQAKLEALAYPLESFDVDIHLPGDDELGDFAARVSFPSPRPADHPSLRRAVMLWYPAAGLGIDGQQGEAPAVLVIHTLHPQMIIGKAIARGLAHQGIHAFLLQMPGYGDRGVPAQRASYTLLKHAAQAATDVRRARDAVAVMPGVSAGPVALQGTSLGGFVATVGASMDNAFDPVLLMISGADGYSVLENGQQDAAWLRQQLAEAGYSGQALRDMLDPVEPALLAHRLDPERTWLFTARSDKVVPKANSDLLASVIGLTGEHHLQLPGDHYTVMFHLPALVTRMQQIINDNHAADALADHGDGQ